MTTTSILAAEYTTGSKTREPILTINLIENGTRTFIHDCVVTGKREARYFAKQFGATPWNF